MNLTIFEGLNWKESVETVLKMPLNDHHQESIIDTFINDSLETEVKSVTIPVFLNNYDFYHKISEKSLYNKFKSEPSFAKTHRLLSDKDKLGLHQVELAKIIVSIAEKIINEKQATLYTLIDEKLQGHSKTEVSWSVYSPEKLARFEYDFVRINIKRQTTSTSNIYSNQCCRIS